MNEYAKASLTPITVPSGFISGTAEIDDTVMYQVISLNGKIDWLGGNGRPDLAAGHIIIAGQYKSESTQLVSDSNICVKQAHAHQFRIRVWAIPPWLLRFVCFCDSSFDFNGERHQQGWMVCFINKYVLQFKHACSCFALCVEVAQIAAQGRITSIS